MSDPDTTGWSSAWRHRLARATPGLSVPRNTPRGRSERRFLALFDGAGARTFRSLCQQAGEPPKDWGLEQWVMDLLRDLKRVGSVAYERDTRCWYRTARGAAVADADAEWVVGPVDA